MLHEPVLGDLPTPTNPNAIVAQDVVHESREGLGSSRAAHEATVKADRHHFGLALALLVQSIEREP
jgi:hypothetical protein